MISLSQEWIEVSKARAGKDFVKELSDLLEKNNAKNILECGCGGGHVLYGLSGKGFNCIGIDSEKEMIDYARQNYSNENLKYILLNWSNLNSLDKKFDAVICRGGSLSCGTSWNKSKEEFNSEKARDFIYSSIGLMLNSIHKDGLLYVDTISQKEIDNNGGDIKLKTENLDLKGKIEYNWKNRVRYMYGDGLINGEYFSGNSTSYLITPNELMEIISSFNPKKLWKQNMKHEKSYDVICAIK